MRWAQKTYLWGCQPKFLCLFRFSSDTQETGTCCSQLSPRGLTSYMTRHLNICSQTLSVWMLTEALCWSIYSGTSDLSVVPWGDCRTVTRCVWVMKSVPVGEGDRGTTGEQYQLATAFSALSPDLLRRFWVSSGFLKIWYVPPRSLVLLNRSAMVPDTLKEERSLSKILWDVIHSN